MLILAGCQFLPSATPEDGITITLVADGVTQVLVVSADLTVSDVLRREGIVLGDTDRVNPPGYSRVSEGMTITVVRVVEETTVIQETVPFRSRTVPNDGLPAGETLLLQAGINGVAEVTYRILFEDGAEVTRSEVRRVLITPPQDEVIMVGSQGDLPTVTVNGTLAYISSGNAWIIRQNSANRRPLTLDGGLDERVFDLSADGSRLLFSRSAEGAAAPGSDAEAAGVINTLWAILDTSDPEAQPIRLDQSNVLFAAWVPGTERTIVYSTAEPRASFPGWQANNDLWRAQISPTGALAQRRLLLEPSSGGIYGWYGTVFAFAPDGVTLAWAQPDAVGVLLPVYEEPSGETGADPTIPPSFETDSDLPPLPDSYRRQTLATFAPWNAYDFVWIPALAWSPDSELLATVTHGPPLGSELPEDSPVFSLTILPRGGGYRVDLAQQVGMWGQPAFSPAEAPDGTLLDSDLLVFQAEQPLDSVYSRYRLVMMDRDGSNRRSLYPAPDQPGLLPQPIAWSPDGRQIALVAPGPQGNLLLVDIATGLAQQVTTDGQSSLPRWTP